MSDARAVLESIAYGHDAKITPGDRVRALEQLADLDAQATRATATERLSPEEAFAEVESLAKAAPGWLAVARGVEYVKPPASEADVVIARQAELIADQESELASLRAQLSGERQEPPAARARFAGRARDRGRRSGRRRTAARAAEGSGRHRPRRWLASMNIKRRNITRGGG